MSQLIYEQVYVFVIQVSLKLKFSVFLLLALLRKQLIYKPIQILRCEHAPQIKGGCFEE